MFELALHNFDALVCIGFECLNISLLVTSMLTICIVYTKAKTFADSGITWYLLFYSFNTIKYIVLFLRVAFLLLLFYSNVNSFTVVVVIYSNPIIVLIVVVLKGIQKILQRNKKCNICPHLYTLNIQIMCYEDCVVIAITSKPKNNHEFQY